MSSKISIETQTPQSSFPQMSSSLVYPNITWHAAIDFKNGSLPEQRMQLRKRKEKLRADYQDVQKRLAKVEKQAGVVRNLEQDFQSMKSSILPVYSLPNEANFQRSLLAKFGADLRQQIDFVESQLNESTIELQQTQSKYLSIDEDKATMKMVKKKIREQEFQLKTLKSMSDALDSEVLSRENEVIQLEFEARNHQNAMNEAKQKKKELFFQKFESLKKKEDIQNQIKAIEKQKNDFEQKKVDAEKELLIATNCSKSLNAVEEELNEKEKQNQEKTEMLNRLRSRESEDKLNRTVNQMEKCQQNRKVFHVESIEQEEEKLILETGKLEVQTANDERNLNKKSEILKITKLSQDKAFETRMTKVNSLMFDMKMILASKSSIEKVDSDIQKAREKKEQMVKEIAEKKKEIESIKLKLLNETKIEQMKADLASESKWAIVYARKINSELLSVKDDERSLEIEEDSIAQNLKIIKTDIELSKKNYDATIAMLKLAKEQSDSLEKRLKVAQNVFKKEVIIHDFDSDDLQYDYDLES